MPTEPKWPTVDEVEAEVARRSDAHLEWSYSGVAIEMCRAAWLAANDDPSADLPGTVRISPVGDMTVLASVSYSDVAPWMNLTAISTARQGGWWIGDSDVVGWTRGTPIPGTPAAKAVEL